jgi:pentatricopeptide repeat protein
LNELVARGLVPSSFTYNTFISGHTRKGNLKETLKLHVVMVTKGLIPSAGIHNVLISGFAEAGMIHQASGFLHEMQHVEISAAARAILLEDGIRP